MRNLRQPSASFWRGRRVLLTGHTGFKGSWLSALLVRLGATVHGVALEPETTPALWTLLGLDEHLDSRIIDIRDGDRLTADVMEFRPQTILHLAAQPIVKIGYERPRETYETNVMGTLNILEAARATSSVGEIVIVTSDKVYADFPIAGGYREDSRLGGADPYAGSKAAAELVTETYRSAFFSAADAARIATARAGNVIGGGDYAANRLLPDFVRAINEEQLLILRHPDAVRPWQHVLDPLTGYVLIAESLAADTAYGRPWNFGPNEHGIAVSEVVRIFAHAWGRPDGDVFRVEARAEHETAQLDVDASDAREKLGWQPRWDVATAIARAASWYRDFLGGSRATALVERDLADYVGDGDATATANGGDARSRAETTVGGSGHDTASVASKGSMPRPHAGSNAVEMP